MTILRALRDRTRAEHDAIDASLGLMSEALTREEYSRVVARFCGFWNPLEAALLETLDLAAVVPDLQRRVKAPLLEHDLQMLHVEMVDVATRARLPRLDTVAAALGVLYVLEGASLGGRVIERHVQHVLGINRDNGARFFHGYGEETPLMWRTFQEVLRNFPRTRRVEVEMVEAANETFRALRAWCAVRS